MDLLDICEYLHTLIVHICTLINKSRVWMLMRIRHTMRLWPLCHHRRHNTMISLRHIIYIWCWFNLKPPLTHRVSGVTSPDHVTQLRYLSGHYNNNTVVNGRCTDDRGSKMTTAAVTSQTGWHNITWYTTRRTENNE